MRGGPKIEASCPVLARPCGSAASDPGTEGPVPPHQLTCYRPSRHPDYYLSRPTHLYKRVLRVLYSYPSRLSGPGTQPRRQVLGIAILSCKCTFVSVLILA